MIELRRIDHVCLRVADVAEATRRWAVQFGLAERSRDHARSTLACNDEPYCLELIAGDEAGFDHVAFELAATCPPELARAHLEDAGVEVDEYDGSLLLSDHDGRGVQLTPHRPEDARVQHARPSSTLHPGGPRRLGHVNCLTGRLAEGVRFYTEMLGMQVSDRLGTAGVWFRINTDHHVMALIDKGAPHFHHFAFDTVDLGKQRDMLDHLARHGRWVGWGPVRHGVGGNIATYVRVVEESCFVELYCDMEQLQPDHRPRDWPDDRFSSNTWGPLPPRSYFRFDQAAVESERESREMLGMPLAPEESA